MKTIINPQLSQHQHMLLLLSQLTLHQLQLQDMDTQPLQLSLLPNLARMLLQLEVLILHMGDMIPTQLLHNHLHQNL